MGFECSPPSGFSKNLGFGSSACFRAGLTQFWHKGPKLFCAGQVLSPKTLCVCWESAVLVHVHRGLWRGWGKRSLFLNWFYWITDTVQHAASADSADFLCWALSDSDSEAARERLRLLALTLSLLGGGEFINLFGTLDVFLTVCNNWV